MKNEQFGALRAAFANLPQGAMLVSGGKIEYANPALEKVAGKPLEGANICNILGDRSCELDALGPDKPSAVIRGCHLFGLVYTLNASYIDCGAAVTLTCAEAPQPALGPPVEMLSAIGYEFRTPLAMIFSSVNLLASRIRSKKDEKTEKYISVLSQSCYRLLRLSNNLTDISRFIAGAAELRAENGDIVAFCREFVALVERQAETKGVPVSFFSELPAAYIAFDREKIERILLNLISNSMRYTREGNAISVSVAGGENILITVSDSGAGISESRLGGLFEWHAKSIAGIENIHGLGLGLPFVRLAAELHGGSVMLESRENIGTTVTVALPNKMKESGVSAGAHDYAGGLDHVLLELSDILPEECFAFGETE